MSTHPHPFDNLPKGYGYKCIYSHPVLLASEGVPFPLITWCGQNLNHRWGWHFEGPKAIMTFENDKEALWFSMNKV